MSVSRIGMKPWRATLAAVLSLSLLGGSPALAQDRNVQPPSQNISVRERPKPEYAAAGIRVGGFFLYPTLDVAAEYDDNIFGTAANTVSDSVVEIIPGAELRSNWNTHQLDFSVVAPQRYYNDHTENNTSDFLVSADGRLDVYRDFVLFSGLRYGDLHESLASSPSAQPLAEPVNYSLFRAQAGVARSFNRLRLSGEATYANYDYRDGRLTNGTALEQDDRDHSVIELNARSDYSLSAMTSFFVSLSANERGYRVDPPFAPINRDSHGYEALAGVKFDVTRLIRGEVGLGYLHQSHDAADVKASDGLAVRANLEWFPDRLVTVSFGAEREVEDAGAAGASSYVANNASVAVDYEWRRNLVLGVRADYSRDDYSGIDREDRRFSTALSADYLMNRGVSFFVEIERAEQNSRGLQPGREYDANRSRVGIRLAR